MPGTEQVVRPACISESLRTVRGDIRRLMISSASSMLNFSVGKGVGNTGFPPLKGSLLHTAERAEGPEAVETGLRGRICGKQSGIAEVKAFVFGYGAYPEAEAFLMHTHAHFYLLRRKPFMRK